MFPVDPASMTRDDRGLFLVQDSELRSRVLPLFSFDPQAPEVRPRGHGTAFRIDPWSRCATAYHVLEDLFTLDATQTEIELRADIRLAVLESPLIFGAPAIPTDAWRPLAGSYALLRIETPPFQVGRVRNLTELVVLRIRPSRPSEDGTPYLPVDLRRWWPRLGEPVMALGYADLDRPPLASNDARPIAQELWGAVGEIIDIEPPDGARAHPWPLIRISGEWPGGMSGGPVFNEAGHVIGLVSSGIEGVGVGTASIFAPWDMPERIFGSLDPDNPGRFRCYGVFDAAGELVHAGQDLNEVRRVADAGASTDIVKVSIDPHTGEHVRSQHQ